MIPIVLFTLFLLIAQPCNAETIVTGDSVVETSISTNANDGKVESSVTSKVTGNGEVRINVENNIESSTDSKSTSNVYRKVETTINGETKTYESTDSGEMRIDIVATTSPISPTAIPPKPKPTEAQRKQTSQLMKLLQSILGFFK